MRFYRGFYPAFDMARYEKFKEVFSLPEKSPIRRMSKGMQKQALEVAEAALQQHLAFVHDAHMVAHVLQLPQVVGEQYAVKEIIL